MTCLGGKICCVKCASQPDIQYWCDQTWDIPEWKQPHLKPGIYLGQNNRLYTFDETLVDCEKCIKKGL